MKDVLINEDDDIEYDKLSILLNDTNASEKKVFIENVVDRKDLLLSEINKNKILREDKRNKQVAYIIKKNKDIDLSSIIVDMLDDKDLKILYDKVVYNNRSVFKKIMEILTNNQ